MARILVIDDTKNIRKMVKLTLSQIGHNVSEAEDGPQGLEAFGDGSEWDLTLVDQRMPGMEGIELVREAKRRAPAARLILMTAYASSELASEVLNIGAMDFLRKPFSTATLRGAVETALKLEPQVPVSDQANEPFSSQTIPMPEPGTPGFAIPSLSYRVNGFSFWPVTLVPEPQKPSGMEFGRFFQLHSPQGEFSRCFVGITSHIKEQVQREVGRDAADDDVLWDKVCGQALLNFIWESPSSPPVSLPVYEVPADVRNNRPAEWMRRPRDGGLPQ